MATTYENQVLNETFKRENNSRKEWTAQHAGEQMVYPPGSQKMNKLDALKASVSDLCDLQPTPSSMVRPPRKEMLKTLKAELTAALGDVESELDEMGGSVSEMSMKSKATAKTAASKKSTASKATTAAPAPAALGSVAE